MLYDPRIERRAKRRTDALKRVEQIDKVIARLENDGWCQGIYHVLLNDATPIDAAVITEALASGRKLEWHEMFRLSEQHCLVGAILASVPVPRSGFYALVARQLPRHYCAQASPTTRLIEYNDTVRSVSSVMRLLHKARARQVKRAGLCTPEVCS